MPRDGQRLRPQPARLHQFCQRPRLPKYKSKSFFSYQSQILIRCYCAASASSTASTASSTITTTSAESTTTSVSTTTASTPSPGGCSQSLGATTECAGKPDGNYCAGPCSNSYYQCIKDVGYTTVKPAQFQFRFEFLIKFSFFRVVRLAPPLTASFALRRTRFPAVVI